ncbi:MAG: fatty acid desaturase family protein [bacterium]
MAERDSARTLDPAELAGGDSKRWLDYLSADEIRELRQMHDWRSWASLVTDWGLIGAALALVARFPNPLSVVLAVAVIGTRQLGLAILMHEASHRTLFRGRGLNDWVGTWLCAYPIWSDLAPYRRYHLQHHAKNWTAEDPDLGLAAPFPVTPSSMRRKIVRDLTGRTALKRVVYTLARHTGRIPDLTGGAVQPSRASLVGVAVTNLALVALLAAAGHPALYLVWVAAWLTTHHLVIRLRSIAEHAMILDPGDPLRNTRTTLASGWERLLLAPNYVNYHLEHHLVMTVPHYQLPRMHRLLRERGALDHACVAEGYLGVLRLAASKPERGFAAPAPANERAGSSPR